MCANPCPAGKFGPQCGLNCRCYNNAACEPTNGNCVCKPGYMGTRSVLHVAHGSMDEAAHLRSKGLRFDSHCWSYVGVAGQLLIPFSALSLLRPDVIKQHKSPYFVE